MVINKLQAALQNRRQERSMRDTKIGLVSFDDAYR